jgi:hypothetical protein
MSSPREKANWNDQEMMALIDFLVVHKGEAGDGANFKETIFRQAAAAIAPLRTAGPAKTSKMCRIKWGGVMS